jgi:hypothetical protein
MSDDGAANLHVSANQWRMSILKACVGSYLPRGIAEDVADAGLAVLAQGVDPLPCLLTSLENYQPQSPQIHWPKSDGVCQLGGLQVLHHGPSVVDLVQAGAQPEFEIDRPLLLLGLAQARLHSHGLGLEVHLDGSNWTTPAEAIAQLSTDSQPCSMSLRSASNGDPVSLNATQLPQPKRDQWQTLQTLAAQIMVPADATSRADAGSGAAQTDND